MFRVRQHNRQIARGRCAATWNARVAAAGERAIEHTCTPDVGAPCVPCGVTPEQASKGIEDLLAEDGSPEGECPPEPRWHVDSHGCLHGWIRAGSPPNWILCDCEDPANPWPLRAPGDGPRDCACFACMDHQPRWERGRLASCEYKDHHCDDCHEHQRCTVTECGFVLANEPGQRNPPSRR